MQITRAHTFYLNYPCRKSPPIPGTTRRVGAEREEVGGKGDFLDVGQGALSLEGGGEAVVVSVGCPGRKGEERRLVVGRWLVRVE